MSRKNTAKTTGVATSSPIIISVINTKGGCGKTVTSVNLAAAMAMAGKRVLLIDLDGSFSATTYFLSIEATPPSTIYDVMFGGVALADAVTALQTTALTQAATKLQLAILAGDERMNLFERRVVEEDDPYFLLRGLFSPSPHREPYPQFPTVFDFGFDVVILDTPGLWGGVVRNATLASTHLIVPINSEQLALEQAQDTLERVARQSTACGVAPPQFRLLLTAYRETHASREVEELCRELWPHNVLKTRVRFTEEVKRLSSDRKTILQRKAATLREDYQNISKELDLWLSHPTKSV